MKKKALTLVTLGLLLILVIAGYSLPIVSADEPSEIIDLRTPSTKTFNLGVNRRQMVAHTGPIHYKEDQDNTQEQYKEIVTDVVPSERPNWDWEVSKGLWQLLIRDDTTVALGRDGNWIGHQVKGIAYLDIDTKDYVVLDTPANVTPIIDGNKIVWGNIFNGINLEYTYIADKFRENFEVTQSARDWAVANPPSSYGLNNQSSYLVFYYEVDWTGAYQAESDNGTSINWDNEHEIDNISIGFRHPAKDYIVASLPASWAYPDDDDPTGFERVKIRKRFIKENDKNWLLLGAKVTELNTLPSGSIIFDPDVTFNPDPHVEVSSVDGRVWRVDGAVTWATIHDDVNGSGFLDATDSFLALIEGAAPANRYNGINRSFILFDTSALPDTAIISATTLSLYGKTKVDNLGITPTLNIYSSNPASNTGLAATDYDQVGTTAYCDASITFAGFNTGVPGASNDFVFNATGLAAISLTGVTKLSAREASYDAPDINPGWGGGVATSTYFSIWSADKGAGYAPKLVVTYIFLATVTNSPPSGIFVGDATLNGNITNTGDGNCTERGFVWDTVSRANPGNVAPPATYADSWTEVGSFGTGAFDREITGLTELTLYHYRACAESSTGDWSYSGEIEFFMGEEGKVYRGREPILNQGKIGNLGVPTIVAISNVFYGYSLPIWSDPANINEQLKFHIDIPEWWDGESDLLIYIHVATSGDESDNAYGVQLTHNHSTPNVVEALSAAGDMSLTRSRLIGSALTYAHYADIYVIAYDYDPADPMVFNDHMGFRVRRIANELQENELDGEIIVLSAIVYFADDISWVEGLIDDLIDALIEEGVIIGGEEVEELGIQFGIFNGILGQWSTFIMIALGLILIIGLSILAFWKYNAVLFMLLAGASIVFGLYWFDALTTNLGLSLGLMLIAYSLVCIGFAFVCIFRRGRITEE